MDKEQAINLAREYKKIVSDHLPVKDAYLYGSYSKGTFHMDSDIDVAIIVEELNKDYFKDSPLLWKLRRRVSSLIEPILLTQDPSNPMYADILSSGIRI